ncbi:MAG: RDD family protein [Nevskiales bacterium]
MVRDPLKHFYRNVISGSASLQPDSTPEYGIIIASRTVEGQKMSEPITTGPTAPPASPMAGFWRRVAAFAVDGLILGLVGAALGLVAFDRLAELGAWGRALGFVISLAYFGLMDSRYTQGQTPGKRLLKIRVVRTDGALLGPGASMLRFCVVGVPYFLNGIHFRFDAEDTRLVTLLSVAIFGLGLSIVYLLVFNRRTRQSLHDLVTGSCVINAGGSLSPGVLAPVWRGHYIAIALIIVSALAAPLALSGMWHNATFGPLLATQNSLMREPEISFAGVTAGTIRNFNSNAVRRTIGVKAILAHKLDTKETLADRLAGIVLGQYPDTSGVDDIDIVLVYGYDIGIASAWRSEIYRHSPPEWQQRLAGAKE